jgi:hypothetical protein
MLVLLLRRLMDTRKHLLLHALLREDRKYREDREDWKYRPCLGNIAATHAAAATDMAPDLVAQ